MTELIQRILKTEQAARKELVALPIGEKFRILEQRIAAPRSITATHPRKPANSVRILR